jgi:CxxC-x17-CxxC domain-containing protein
MEAQFVDRILTCSDCHGEFVFTAGEQLFFYDKQFKNDPKRCKPCKSRRSGLSAAAHGGGLAAAGISRTETRTECSECGVQTTVPFKPTQGRPVLCRQCFQMKSRAAVAPTYIPAQIPPQVPVQPQIQPLAASGAGLRSSGAVAAPVTPVPVDTLHAAVPLTATETRSALTTASLDSRGRVLSPEAAELAAASMAAASPESSVATAADLASISPRSETAPVAERQEILAGMLAPSETLPGQLACPEPAEFSPEQG